MVDIYNLLKSSIEIGGFELGKKLNELTSIMIVGQIDSGEYEQLVELARKHANTETEPGANLLGALQTLTAELADVKERLSKLEAASGEEPAEDEYPEWVRWDGQPGSGYRFGAKVTHLGVKYVSNFAGLNVWEPGAPNTGALWTVVG